MMQRRKKSTCKIINKRSWPELRKPCRKQLKKVEVNNANCQWNLGIYCAMKEDVL